IAARLGVVGRDGFDACVYRGTTAPVNKAPPTVTKQTRPLPGEEYETAKPPPPTDDVDETAPPVIEPVETPENPPAETQNQTELATPPEPPQEPANGI